MERIARSLSAGHIPHDRPRRRFTVRKANGSLRPIEVPSIDEAIAQRAVLAALTPHLDGKFLASSVAFRPGKDRLDAIRMIAHWQAAGAAYAFHADIEAYFEQIPHAGLHKAIRSMVRDGPMAELLEDWLRSVGEVTTAHRFLFRHHSIRGLPQGAILSPILANVFLHRLDTQALRAGLRYVRYADDILIVTRSERAARSAGRWLARRLSGMDLRLAQHKSGVESLTGCSFLGVRLPVPETESRFRSADFADSRYWLGRQLAARGGR